MPVTVPVGYETEGAQLDADMTRDAKRAGGKAGKAGGQSFSTGFKSLIKPLAGLGAGLAVKDFLGDSIDEAREAQKVGALTTQALRATGNAANISAKQVGDLATAISNKVGIDDEQIQSLENQLTAFKNVRNEVGKNNDIFTRTTKASVDLAAAQAAASGSAVNFRASTTLLGKALNDPIKGMNGLTKAGVTFTDEQKKRIKSLVSEGKLLDAQKVLLKAVEDRFKGTAASQATAADKAGVAVKNLEEQVGTALLPVLDKAANAVTKTVVPAVSQFITEMQDGTGRGGEFADVIKTDVLPVAKNLGKEAVLVVNALKPLFGILKDLPPGLVAAGGASAFLGSKLGSLRTPLEANATGFAKFGRGLANVGGGVGLLGLADAANQASPALRGLEGAASGALIGLSVGGPLGGLVGALGGGLLSIFSGGEKAADGIDAARVAAEQAVPPTESYADSLRGLSAEYTRSTRAIAVANVQKNKALFSDTGLNPRILVNGILGQKNALAQIYPALDRNYNIAVKNQTSLENQLRLTRQRADTLRGDSAFKGEYDALVKQEAAQKAALKTANDQVDVLGTRRDKQYQVLGGLTQEANLQRQNKALGLEYKDLLNMGIAPAVAKAFDSKQGVGPYTADVANLIDKFHILNKGDWAPIIKAAGLKPGKDTTAAILRDLKNIQGDHNATVHVSVTGDVAMAAALGAFKGASQDFDVEVKRHRAMGGPVTAGVPYVVGERRPEIFVPNQSGRIVPSVGQYASTVASEQAPSFTYAPSFYGPTTGRERLDEMRWAQKFSTRARVAR